MTEYTDILTNENESDTELPELTEESTEALAEELTEEITAEQPEPDPYPCTEECYLCDFGEYCDLREDGSSLIPYEDRHIIDAVENFNCPRRFPRRRYAELIKEADSDD